MYAEKIDTIPVYSQQPGKKEIEVVNFLFNEKKDNAKLIYNDFKQSIIGGLLFVVLSQPFTDSTIQMVVPSMNTYILLTIIKFLTFVILFYFITNLNVVMK